MSQPDRGYYQSRRSFLRGMAGLGAAWTAAACAGGAASVQPAGGAAAARGGWADRVGLQLYSVRDQMEKDFEGTLRRVAQIGYREVEFAGFFGRTPQQVRQLLDELGLRAPSSHVGLDLLRQDLAGQLQTARTIGNEYVTVPALPEAFSGGTLDLAYWNRTAAELNRIAAAAKQQGLGLAYHNHWFEFDRLPDGRTGWDVLVAETDPSLVQFELDLLWATFAGHDPVQLFQRSPGRYVMWHVKDMRDLAAGQGLARGADVQGIMAAALPRLAAVGEGEIDFRRIFAQAATAGMRHFFVENDAAPTTPSSIANVETSYRNLTRLLG